MKSKLRRGFIGSSGFLLAICFFLPKLQECGAKQPTYPIDQPHLCSPYVLGLLIGLTALVPRRRALAIAIRIVLWLSVAAGTVAGLTPKFEPFWLFVAATAATIAGFGRCDDRGSARAALATATIGILWFGILSVSGTGLIGAHLSFAASFGLLVGGALWWHELGEPAPIARPIELPVARVARIHRDH